MESPLAASVVAEEQQEKLRRFVDEWRPRIALKFQNIQGDVLEAVGCDLGNINSDPVHISTEVKESATILSLVDTNNVLFNKLMIVLAYDCVEIERLRRQAYKRFYPQLLSFGLPTGPEELVLEGEPQKMFGRSLLFFYDLTEFLGRLRAVLSNLVQQLEALYAGDSKSRIYASFANVHLQTVILYLADGFAILVTVDEIVNRNPAIGQSISLFVRMLHTIRMEPSKFAVETGQIESLDRTVTDMEEVVQVGLFQRCFQQDFLGHPQMEAFKCNRRCLDEMSFSLHEGFMHILSRLDTLKERFNDRIRLVGLLAVFMFYAWMCVESPERKLGKVVAEITRRAPMLHVYCNIKLQPLELLMSHSPPWVLSLSVLKEARKEAGSVKNNFLATLDDTLVRDIQVLQSEVASWVVTFDPTSAEVRRLPVNAMLRSRAKQLVQGIYLACRLQHLIRATLDIHVALEIPIKKEKLIYCFQGVSLLKAIEDMYHRRSSDIGQSIFQIMHLLQSQISRRLLPLKAQLEADLSGKSRNNTLSLLSMSLTRSVKDMDTKLLDSLASVNLALKMLRGAASEKRRVILSLCLDVINGLQPGLQEESRRKIGDFLSELEIAADINTLVETSTNCSFLYTRKEMMSIWFPMMYGQAEKALQIQFILNAFVDGIKMLKKGNADTQTISRYEQEIESSLTNDVIEPLCRDIETDLRLHVHSAHLKGSVTINPTKTGVRDLSSFICIKPLRVASKYIHIKARVETYLNAAFYNHAAMALHNWKTYCEMRHLAEQKYGLHLDDIHLPGQMMEQGVDVLEIVRNIHNFVACYTYNLNTQVFMERISNARERKYLTIISVKHLANSIRTHGLGILSTTVNFVYQFLAHKLLVFSQFLYDDHIKSRLVKEHRFWKDCQEKQKEYPVVNAEKLNRDIRKLGLTDDGMSFLDQFRQVITEMGNALGFVRMIRMGGLHHASAASGFVQAVKDKTNFEEAARKLRMHSGAVRAGAILDRSLKMQELPVEQTNYFRILTAVFTQELQSIDNVHLNDFYLILPALIMNSMEAMVQSKERLFKRGRDSSNALFSDDGLVLGIAYILKVLDQYKKFDSLHWFESARKHFTSEKARVQSGLDMDSVESGMNGLQVWSQKFASLSEEDAQSMQLTTKRLRSCLTELELIEYNFTSARIFFQ